MLHSIERLLANTTIVNATNLLLSRQALAGTRLFELASDDHFQLLQAKNPVYQSTTNSTFDSKIIFYSTI